jgi:hypothetical protein
MVDEPRWMRIGIGLWVVAFVSPISNGVFASQFPKELIAASPSSQSPVPVPRAVQPLRPPATCPDQLELLTPLLLRDLPPYANRVSQVSRVLGRPAPSDLYVLRAGRAELEPLPLMASSGTPSSGDVRQVFFTTRERQYKNNQVAVLENYHWLFLVPTEEGWRMVFLFSRFGNVPPLQPPTPPEDTTQGVIGEAVRLWLRDCATGNIVP